MNPLSIQFNVTLWREGETYIAYVPQLDVSSCGKTIDDARKNIQDAVDGFVEEASEMGTLKQILEEGGFVFDNQWRTPEFMTVQNVSTFFTGRDHGQDSAD